MRSSDPAELRTEDTTGRFHWLLVVPALVAGVSAVSGVAFSGGAGAHWPTEAQTIAILVATGALFFRLRWPLPVTAVTVLAGAAQPWFPPHYILVDVLSMVALCTLASLVDRRTAWTAGGIAIVALTISSVLWQPGHLLNIRNLLPANYVALSVAVGDSVRNRRAYLRQAQERVEQAEHSREQEALRRVREERIRIARDLHDVVAQHITLVNAQAGVAHHLLRADPGKAAQALADIRETSRAALDELRATVGLLRQDDDPAAGLQPAPRFERLEELLNSFRTTGLDIRLTRQGPARALTGSADVAGYRIVQEALTNATKHGVQPRAEVDLDYTDTVLRLAVANPAAAGRRGPGTGYGLIGMRERAEAAGGSCTAELRPNGTFVVYATLPLRVSGEAVD